ncbi:hypothetical protein GJU40_16230 [Bacillus lacus]|uniref:Uncharacterized protein n=1 Tax=Metabacillus lacus TaxID=1983721 RepID=A0A7X2J1P3_9BACI|nr:hypothetical protein [Metabacillus lacus]MRX73689.1 hypothetical protein [Metabacillus lacus]
MSYKNKLRKSILWFGLVLEDLISAKVCHLSNKKEAQKFPVLLLNQVNTHNTLFIASVIISSKL